MRKEEGNLIQPLKLKVDPWGGKRWSYSAAYTEGRSLRRKVVILYSRLYWRSIPKEDGDLIQPLALKFGRKKVILFSRLHWRSIRRRWSYLAAYTEGRPLRVKVILFSRLHWTSIHRENGCLTDYRQVGLDGMIKGDMIITKLTLVKRWWYDIMWSSPIRCWWNDNDMMWYDCHQSGVGETMKLWYDMIWLGRLVGGVLTEEL